MPSFHVAVQRAVAMAPAVSRVAHGGEAGRQAAASVQRHRGVLHDLLLDVPTDTLAAAPTSALCEALRVSGHCGVWEDWVIPLVDHTTTRPPHTLKVADITNVLQSVRDWSISDPRLMLFLLDCITKRAGVASTPAQVTASCGLLLQWVQAVAEQDEDLLQSSESDRFAQDTAALLGEVSEHLRSKVSLRVDLVTGIPAWLRATVLPVVLDAVCEADVAQGPLKATEGVLEPLNRFSCAMEFTALAQLHFEVTQSASPAVDAPPQDGRFMSSLRRAGNAAAHRVVLSMSGTHFTLKEGGRVATAAMLDAKFTPDYTCAILRMLCVNIRAPTISPNAWATAVVELGVAFLNAPPSWTCPETIHKVCAYLEASDEASVFVERLAPQGKLHLRARSSGDAGAAFPRLRGLVGSD